VVAAQYAFGALVAACGYLALARAAHFAGHWYVPSVDDRYTATADIYADWPWATLVSFTVPIAPMVAGLGLVVSAVLFLLGYTRGHRALTLALIGSTAVTLATLAVTVTPPAQALIGWVVD
jgi:hypothetical protein